MHVFVSYQRADALFAAHMVAYALRLAGHDAFVDTGGIGGGAAWADEIGTQVDASDVVLALVGPTFSTARLHESTNVVAYEWRRAHARGKPVVPVLVERPSAPSADELPADLGWFGQRQVVRLRAPSLDGDITALNAAVAEVGRASPRAARILWVDDRPANNERERRELRRSHVVFDNVVSTREALEQLAQERYDLVITDVGRTGSSDRSSTAGSDLLDNPALAAGRPPVIVYTAPGELRRRDELVARGARAVVAVPSDLFAAVRGILCLDVPPATGRDR